MIEKLKIATSEDEVYFYSASIEKDTENGCIGHVRGDFGKDGEAFWATWFEHISSLKTPDFREELGAVIQSLTEQGVLQNRSCMHDFCIKHSEARLPGARHSDVYGFCLQTEKYRYYLRCFPRAGDYNFYLYCYARPERLTEQSRENPSIPVSPKKKTEPER
ncbi:hypothetical protein MHH60_25905 [Paenibacillus sp. FSL H7-0716]|uniref:Uncharacterized protein n=1 Tax=Paenibacillus odorifer TaxID=189426 RepID=A0AB36JF46_9BACL|nr:hypothetical protein [Paenibacillus odorifer]OME19796.1 hypothetical protein BSK47_14580 [Paenibacillus odorifer]